MNARENRPQPKGPVIQTHGDQISFVPEFEERLQRNVETASKLGQPFALYWIKADQEDITLNRAIARLAFGASYLGSSEMAFSMRQ